MKKLVIGVLLMAYAISSYAGFMVEPSIGATIGTVDTKQTVAGQNLKYGISGTEMGLKVGYSFLGANLGVSYYMGSTDFEIDQPTNQGYLDLGFDSTKTGVYAGFNFPILLRAWGIYHLDSEYKGTTGDKDVHSGKGYTLGIGLTPIPVPLPFISLSFNLEYSVVNLDEVKDGSTGVVTAENWDVNEIKLSVSTPLDF
jgi:hypothetical protein